MDTSNLWLRASATQRDEHAEARAPAAETAPPDAAPSPDGSLDLVAAHAARTRDAAETATTLGWITHDVREVAEKAGIIAGAAQELASSIQSVSQTGSVTAQGAEKVREEAVNCRTEMEEAGRTMREIGAQMDRIGERLAILDGAVDQITEMAGAIDAISRQTNLLALNATIEAARAGNAGRGFVVVASEVKSLSGQTARATEQIQQRLETLVAEMETIKAAMGTSAELVAAGGRQVGAAEQRMEPIGLGVGDIAERMSGLVETLAQQQQATDEISSSVSGIAEKADKTRAEIDDVRAALEACERATQDALDETCEAGRFAHCLARLSGDAAAWKRRLAHVLVGLEAPSEEISASLAGANAWFTDDAAHPAAADLAARERAVRALARKVLDAVAAGDWSGATEVYMSAESSLAALVQAALLQTAREESVSQVETRAPA